jgi:hypothetical protein
LGEDGAILATMEGGGLGIWGQSWWCIEKCDKRDVFHRKSQGGWTRVERTRLIKGHIMGNTRPSTDRIPTPITLMLIAVSWKDTLNRSSGQFGVFMLMKKNIAITTKQTKRRVIRRTIKKTLERNTTLQSSRWLDIDEIGGSGYSSSLKVRWKGGSDHHRTRCLKKVMVLAFSHTILSVSTKTRKLGKSTLFS